MMLRILTLFLLLFSTFTSQAGRTFEVQYRQVIRSGFSEYNIESPQRHTYKMVMHRTISDHQVVGEGPFRTHNFKIQGVENTYVLGVDVPGYARMSFEPAEDEQFCYITFSSYNQETGERNEVREKARFIEGRWSLYLQGDRVRLRIQNEEQELRNALVLALQMLDQSISSDGMLTSYKKSDPQIIGIQTQGHEEFSGSLSNGFTVTSPQVLLSGGLKYTLF
ncbi:MAG: hypothetical protein KDD61_14505 [Bdellovibrionales bacterium]|nr:hypothetical protein [Bdellovibrionales bacterium]